MDVEDYIDSDKYSDIGLHEEEKKAIRRFVGSSMLNTSDILDWDQFCRTTWDQRSASGAPGVRPAHGEPDCEDGTTASKGRRLGDGNRKGSEAGSCQAGRAPSSAKCDSPVALILDMIWSELSSETKGIVQAAVEGSRPAETDMTVPVVVRALMQCNRGVKQDRSQVRRKPPEPATGVREAPAGRHVVAAAGIGFQGEVYVIRWVANRGQSQRLHGR